MAKPALFLAALAVLIGLQIFIPPVVSLGNNGDFGKLIGRFCLAAPVSDEIIFAPLLYSYDSRYCHRGEFYSSELLFATPTLFMGRWLSKTGIFDIRAMGAVHLLALLSAACLATPPIRSFQSRRSTVLLILAGVMYSDVMYTAYLNSFYSDVAAYIGLHLAAACFVRLSLWRRRSDLILFTISTLIVVTSKGQHAVIGPWAVLGILLAVFPRAVAASRPLLIASMAAILCASAGSLWISPAHYMARNCYSAIFHQLLPHVRDQEKALAELGLSAAYLPHVGKHAYSPGSQMDEVPFVEDFLRRTSYSTLFRYYFRHPGDTYAAMVQSLSEAGRQRPVLGNFDRAAGLPERYESQAFALWSNLKRSAFDQHGTRYLWCLIGLWCSAIGVVRLQWKSSSAGLLAGILVLLGISISELIVSSLADAIEVPRHHLLFYSATDLLLLAVLTLVPFRGKYTGTHG